MSHDKGSLNSCHTRRFSRRQLMLGAAASVALPCFVPGRALGLAGQTPANDRIVVGCVGVGVRGREALRFVLALGGTQVVAVGDPRTPRREAAVHDVEKCYADEMKKGAYKGCAAYNDFREVIGRSDVDLVMVCPPDHWHGVVMTQAARAGKDMYAEKPIARSITESVAIRDAVRRHGCVFQTGTQQRSDSRFWHACMLARNGYLGKIHTIQVGAPGGREYAAEPPAPVPQGFDYDMWSGPAPLLPFDNKRCEWLAMYMISHYCAGFICNWGVHHLDIAQWGCPEVTREPFELDGHGEFPKEGMADTCITWNCEFKYPSGLRMLYSNSGNPCPQGCKFEGDEGWVHVNRSGIWAEPRSLLDVQFKPSDVQLHRSPVIKNAHPNPTVAAYTHHTADLLRSIRTREDPVAPVEGGYGATTLGNVSDIMVHLGRKVKWDWKTDSFVDDPTANAMRTRPMRSPWTL